MVNLNHALSQDKAAKKPLRRWAKRLLLQCGLTTTGTCSWLVELERQQLHELLGRSSADLERVAEQMPAADWRHVQQLLQHLGESGLARLPAPIKIALRGALAHVARLDCDEFPIFLHADSLVENNTRAVSCAKEPMTVQWLRTTLRPGDVLYDIGANIGAYSLYAAKVGQGQVHVVAFEPSFLNFSQLCRNILLNECTGSITPLFVPLCRATGFAGFYHQNVESGAALHVFGKPPDSSAPAGALNTLGYALDDLMRLPGMPAPTLLKIDVDGLEIDILHGAEQTLRDGAVREILVELSDANGDSDRCIGLLHQCGFSPREKHCLTTEVHNYLFERSTYLASEPPRAAQVHETWRRV